MKTLPFTLIICTVAASMAVSSASAQNQASSSQNKSWQKAQAQEFFLASRIIGKDTQTTDDQKPGSIKEVAFNQKGEVFALVDIGNDKLAVVPWQAFNPASAKGNQNVVIDTTLKALQSGPAVTKTQWGELDDPSFTQGVYAYYHLEPPTASGGGSAPGGTSQGQGSK